MGLFEELEKEMGEVEEKVIEVSAEVSPLYASIAAWVFAVCLIALMIGGTIRLLLLWF